MAEGARAGPAPVFRARELTAGTPRRRITNVFKQERLNLSGVWARVRLHGELRRVGCVRMCTETEKYTGKKSVKPRSIKKSNPDVKRMEESLSVALGTKVKLPGAPNKGKIEIEYYSREELERLLELLLSVE